MRWSRATVLTALLAATSAFAQNATAPLEHGRFVMWVVRPAAKDWTPESAALAAATLGPAGIPKTVQEQTAGSFGTASSNVGTNASDYGQTASTLGHNAGDYGHAASTHGQPAGSFGTASSNVGTNAGDYGVSAGSFGDSLSSVASAADRHNNRSQWLFRPGAPHWNRLVGALRSSFPSLTAVIYEVREEDLASALNLAAGTPDAPDVLLGAPLSYTWARANGQALMKLVLVHTTPCFPPQRATQTDPLCGVSRYDRGAEFATLAAAPHPDKAAAFALWFTEGAGCDQCLAPDSYAKDTAAIAALHIARALVTGDAFGTEFDPDAVRVRPGLMQSSGDVTSSLMRRGGGKFLRAFAVRTSVTDASGVHVIHTLVVLRRKDEAAPWRILQITPDMTQAMLLDAADAIGNGASGNSAAAGTPLQPVSLAAPPDGDSRIARPDLWWDNPSNARLEVVEWLGGGTSSHLFLVPDQDSIAKTRVPATFADNGSYRWRVWSVGGKGDVAITVWRTLHILP